jgi:hypothetical protein
VPPFATWSLTLISLAAGWLLGYGFLRLSHRTALAASLNRLRAHLMELRLFADEPSLVWRAQFDLLKANGSFLWNMLRPLAVLALPTALLMWQLEAYYARQPLTVAEPTRITLESTQTATLNSSPAITVETQGIRWNSGRLVSWRIRPASNGIAQLPFTVNGQPALAEIAVGPAFLRLPAQQSLRIADLHRATLHIDYPERRYSLAGLSISWTAWFLLWSSLAAIAAVWRYR